MLYSGEQLAEAYKMGMNDLLQEMENLAEPSYIYRKILEERIEMKYQKFKEVNNVKPGQGIPPLH